MKVEWYKKKSIEVNNLYGKPLGLGFFHIPLPEYVLLYSDSEIHNWKGELTTCPISIIIFSFFKFFIFLYIYFIS